MSAQKNESNLLLSEAGYPHLPQTVRAVRASCGACDGEASACKHPCEFSQSAQTVTRTRDTLLDIMQMVDDLVVSWVEDGDHDGQPEDRLAARKRLEAAISAALSARPVRKPLTELSPEIKAALDAAEKTGAVHAELPNGAIMFINRGHDYGDDADLNCPHCGGSGHKGDVAQPVLTDAQIIGIAINYATFTGARNPYDITKYDCEEDFINCARAIIAAMKG